MTSEVKVTIVAHDGTTKEITGDTAICFTVSKAADYLRGKAKIIDANEALDEYRRAYEQKPDAPEAAQAVLIVGQALTDGERFDEAMELYTQAVNGGVQSGELYNRMGICELDAGNYDQALGYFEKGMLLGDETCKGELLYHQALVYEKKSDFASALGCLEAYAAEFGSSPEIDKEIAFLKTR